MKMDDVSDQCKYKTQLRCSRKWNTGNTLGGADRFDDDFHLISEIGRHFRRVTAKKRKLGQLLAHAMIAATSWRPLHLERQNSFSVSVHKSHIRV
jgi:hypothetical protein